MLDGEHPTVGPEELSTMLSIVAHRRPCYVRVQALDQKQILHALRAGAEGIIVPNVDTAEQAAEAVRIVRSSAWPDAKVAVQAESGEAVRNISAIVRTGGVEWVLIGPYDLTRSLGIAEQFDHPMFREAVATVEDACAQAGMPVGIFGMTAERVKPYEDRGFAWLVIGIDLG